MGAFGKEFRGSWELVKQRAGSCNSPVIGNGVYVELVSKNSDKRFLLRDRLCRCRR